MQTARLELMSIPVQLDDLAATIDEYGAGYLLTTRAGQVKAVTVQPTLTGGTLTLPGSRGSIANLAENPAATLLFPPPQPHGYTLLIDGTAAAGAGGADAGITFTPATAVLHRPAAHSDGPAAPASAGEQTGCENDCRPV